MAVSFDRRGDSWCLLEQGLVCCLSLTAWLSSILWILVDEFNSYWCIVRCCLNINVHLDVRVVVPRVVPPRLCAPGREGGGRTSRARSAHESTISINFLISYRFWMLKRNARRIFFLQPTNNKEDHTSYS